MDILNNNIDIEKMKVLLIYLILVYLAKATETYTFLNAWTLEFGNPCFIRISHPLKHDSLISL